MFEPYGLVPFIVDDAVLLTGEDAGVAKQLKQRVDVDVDDVPLAVALKRLGRRKAINLVVDQKAAKQAEKKVSLQVEDVPLETAVRLLAEQAGMKAARIDNVLYVTTPEHAASIAAENRAEHAGLAVQSLRAALPRAGRRRDGGCPGSLRRRRGRRHRRLWRRQWPWRRCRNHGRPPAPASSAHASCRPAETGVPGRGVEADEAARGQSPVRCRERRAARRPPHRTARPVGAGGRPLDPSARRTRRRVPSRPSGDEGDEPAGV